MIVRDLIDKLQRRINTVLEPLLPRGVPLALVDFPDHPNVGDSAIWLGELAYLRSRQHWPRYRCQIDTYSSRNMKQAIGDGIVLIHGGGNFGDLWQRHQRFREQVIRDFPENRIVQLPQTIHFSYPAALARCTGIVKYHGPFTLLDRDSRIM